MGIKSGWVLLHDLVLGAASAVVKAVTFIVSTHKTSDLGKAVQKRMLDLG